MKQLQLFQKPMLLVCLVLISAFCFPQVTEQWIKRYSGPEYGSLAQDVTLDASGNVYITGLSAGSGTGYDYATIKYNAAGVEVWAKRYNGSGDGNDEANNIVVDGLGNVYVTGYSLGNGITPDITTIKYSPAGNQLWVRRYKGSADIFNRAASLALDASGNIYVSGTSQGDGSGDDFAIVKYNAAGNELWVRRYTGSGNARDKLAALAIDSSGNVYVTGYSTGSNGWSFTGVLIKYNAAGTQLSTKTVNIQFPSTLAPDASGNLYVTGQDHGYYATVKYNAAGGEVWRKVYAGPTGDGGSPVALSLDGLGNRVCNRV